MRTWSEMVAYHAARRPDALFVCDGAGRATYADMHRQLARRATWLLEREVTPGARVALLARNSVALVETLLACQHLGAIAVPLNYRLSADEIAYMLRHSESCLLVADPEFRELADRAVCAEPMPIAVAELRPAAQTGGLGDLPPSTPAAVGLDDVCRIMYTSGTTSRPKGVTLTSRNILVKSIAQAREFGLSYHDHGLVAGPLFHVAALDVTLTTSTYVGGSVRLLDRFDATRTLDHLQHDGVTHAWLAPVMIRRVLDVAQATGVVLGGPRLMIGGGEPTPRELMERIATTFPKTWYANVYGLTETSTGDTVLPQSQAGLRPASVGLPVAEAEVVVLDPEGRPLQAGLRGQVAIGGPKLSPGYWRDPQATAASRHGELFLTGDEGYLDNEGFLFITGRLKDMILSGGENIFPAEVEAAISRLPGVDEVIVFGMPDDHWGERVEAAVTVKPGSEILAEDVRAYSRHELAGYKVPKRVHIVPSLPLTPNNKPDRRALAQLIAAADAEDAAAD